MYIQYASSPAFPEFKSECVGHAHTSASLNYTHTERERKGSCISSLVDELPAYPKETGVGKEDIVEEKGV